MRRLEGRVAVVTGGSSGFGRATAVRLSDEGARVVIGDLDEAKGRETVQIVEQAGGEIDFIAGDIATQAGAAALLQRAAERFGAADILVNNAGIAPQGERGRTWDMTEDDWDRVLRINLKSIYLCSRAAIPAMIAKGRGSIVNIASIAASRTVSSSAYAAAKAGILGYSRQVATELGAAGVRVNSVSPGFMVTPMSTGEREGFTPEQTAQRLQDMARDVPMGKAGDAADIAAAVAYLASDDAAYVTGKEIIVDGGFVNN